MNGRNSNKIEIFNINTKFLRGFSNFFPKVCVKVGIIKLLNQNNFQKI